MPDGTLKPFRWTRGSRSLEHGFLFFIFSPILIPIIDFVKDSAELVTAYRRSLKYHPVALAGIGAVIATYLITPWLTAALFWAVLVWQRGWPYSYRQHAQHRADSFFAGFNYRYRPRRRLTANGLLNDKDPVPTISHVQKIGCTTKVRIKMSDGDEIEWWRLRSKRLAQTYNALDCKVNPYRRQKLNPFSKEMVTKPRWNVLEFLTKDPFTSKMGVEFIDFHRRNTLQPVASITRNGELVKDNLAAHKLAVAMTRWGKSGRIRARICAQRANIRDGILELWGIDGKGGVEQSLLQHAFARVAYGDKGYEEFDQLLKDAVAVMQRRQQKMRGFVTEHVPTPTEPWLEIIVDELLVLTSKRIPPQLRSSIAANIMLIHQQGIACGVTMDASTQLAQKELFGNIERDGFTEFELGKVERGAVDMIFGAGWWQAGVRADELPDDLKGAFYKKTDATMTPEVLRYPNIAVADVSAEAFGFTVDKSALWPVAKPGLPDMPEGSLTAVPESKLEPQPVGRLTDL